MISIKCDVEGCSSSEKMTGDPAPMPTGWALIRWIVETKSEIDLNTKALLNMYKGVVKTAKKLGHTDRMMEGIVEGLSSVEADMPLRQVPMVARICPKCMSHIDLANVELGGFSL